MDHGPVYIWLPDGKGYTVSVLATAMEVDNLQGADGLPIT